MPEGVEVRIQAEGLRQLVGDRIVFVKLHDKGEKIIRPYSEQDLRQFLAGDKILSIREHGKYIVWEFDNDNFLVSHLMMTGCWLIDVPEEVKGHTRIEFHMDSGKKVRYTDTRVFGRIFLEDYYTNVLKRCDKGLNALEADEDDLIKLFDKNYTKVTPIKKFILNQDILSGLGNVYANEALFLAKIHPGRPICLMGLEEIEEIASAIKVTLQRGYELGGLSLKDWFHVDGTKGKTQKHLAVYKKSICNCGTAIIRDKEIDGRATFYCPKCQK